VGFVTKQPVEDSESRIHGQSGGRGISLATDGFLLAAAAGLRRSLFVGFGNSAADHSHQGLVFVIGRGSCYGRHRARLLMAVIGTKLISLAS
jgi:hypothetical protein